MIKNIYRNLSAEKRLVAICKLSNDIYEAMKYYVIADASDVKGERGRDGYFVQHDRGWDFFPRNEFTVLFLIPEEIGSSKIATSIDWIKRTNHIDIFIRPTILDDGYWFEYEFEIVFPSSTYYSKVEKGLNTYLEAAKKAIILVRNKCLKDHSKSIMEWLQYSLPKFNVK
jgi:hypothetical protein